MPLLTKKKTQEHSSNSFSTPKSSGSAIIDDQRKTSVQQKSLQSIANNSPKVKQLLQFQKMANNSIQLSKVAQLRGFDAGEGSKWHIHYDHIKLGKNNSSRVEFNGRSKKAIRKELGEKIDRFGLSVTGDLAESFRECINYINANF